MALLIALVAAVLIVLGVFAWVLLAPLIRFRGEADETERADANAPTTVLFARPVARLRRSPRAPGGSLAAPISPALDVSEAHPDEVQAIEVRATVTSRRALPAGALAQPAVADVLVLTADTSLSDCQVAILAAGGCTSRCAASASDAVDALRLRIPDLFLVDAAGPWEAAPLVTALRAWRATETLPVVLFTGIADDTACRCSAELHVTDVVVDAPSVPRLVERALPYWLAGVSVFSATAG